jgi:ABC transporter transmembrane protein
VIEYWLANDNFRRLDPLASDAANPEYRISEDVRISTDAPIDLMLAFLASVLTAAVFLSVLWNVGGSLDLVAFGRSWTIPGYLVISVVIYSSLFSTAMILVGRELTSVIERKNQSEAEFRAAADRLLQPNASDKKQRHGEAPNALGRGSHGARALAEPVVATCEHNIGLAQQFHLGAGARLVAVRSEISSRHHVARRGNAIRRCIRRRARRVQLARRQLWTHRRLEIIGKPGSHPFARSR